MSTDKAILAFCCYVFGISAQTAAPRPEFEAASIRLNLDGTPYVFNGMKSLGTFSAVNQSLRNLIQEAYGRPSGRRNWLPYFAAAGQGMPIVGGPEWIGERYDITAKWHAAPADGHVTLAVVKKAQAEMELMLQSLLEQRFQVKVHRETRDLPVYELTVATPGKLKQGNCVVFDPERPAASTNYCGASSEGRKGVDWTLDGNGMKMSELADTLSNLIGGRPVIDKTAYTGTFDVHLRWTPGQGETGARDAGVPPDDASASIFSVLQEQLGLRLKAGRGPVEVIVVDRAERPSAN